MSLPYFGVWCGQRGALSLATAMRAAAAIVALAACACCLHAADTKTHVTVTAETPRAPSSFLSVLGIKRNSPAARLLACGQNLGFTKCLNALSVWRAEHAIEALETGRAVEFNVVEDARRFPWEAYANSSDDQIYSQLYDGTEKLLQYRSLSLTLPGYSLMLDSKGNGTLNVDVLKNGDNGEGRSSMKKIQKQFYNVLPLLLLPGLIMSAILPFVLPALKMMTVGVGILNNMALSGAVFTLLRNNAFTDKYEHKIIYVNEGYKNEKLSPVYIHDDDVEHVDVPLEFSSNNVKHVVATDDAVEIPTNSEFINQYYGNEGFKLIKRSQREPENMTLKFNRRKNRI